MGQARRRVLRPRMRMSKEQRHACRALRTCHFFIWVGVAGIAYALSEAGSYAELITCVVVPAVVYLLISIGFPVLLRMSKGTGSPPYGSPSGRYFWESWRSMKQTRAYYHGYLDDIFSEMFWTPGIILVDLFNWFTDRKLGYKDGE